MRINARALGSPRVTLMAGVLAGVVSIAACTDDVGKSITAPSSGPRNATIQTGTYALAATAIVCIDAGAPAGTYKVTNSYLRRMNVGMGGDGTIVENNPDWNHVWEASHSFYVGDKSFSGGPLTPKTSDAVVDPGGHVQVVTTAGTSGATQPTWNDLGGTTSDGGVVWQDQGLAEYVVAPGGCATVLTRSVPESNFCSGPGGQEPGCSLSPNHDEDAFSGVVVEVTTMPAGVTYKRTDCELDAGVKFPKDAFRSAGAPFGHDNNPGNPCDTNNNPSTIYANIAHGMKLTFFFNAPVETPCPAGSFTATRIGEGDLVMVFDQFPAPNDNSYGVNAVGWPSGHTFGNLTGSDKAGFQLKNSSGTVVLDFNIDYLSAKTGTASGYASLGPFGGDGDLNVGTLVAGTDITWTTSQAENLNSTGFCVALNCSGGGTNLLVNSPPTISNTSYTLVAGSPYGAWNFHDTYYVTIKAAKLAALGLGGAPNLTGGWTAAPNLTALHNSPAKPCPAGPFPCSDITIGAKTFGSKEVKVDVNNINTTTDAFVTGVHISWPNGINGALKSIKIGGDVIWTGTDNTGNATFTLAQLVADAGKRKIGKHSDEDVKFTFANNVLTTLASYSASLDFGDNCTKEILP